MRDSRKNRKGSSVIEISLLAPWALFLFVGTVDLGFYSYSLISVENAARIAAEYTSTSTTAATDASGACTKFVIPELSSLPNLRSISSCTASPLTVTASLVTGLNGGHDTSVTVTYQGVSLIPIPGLLTGSLNITRTVRMRVQP
jgi:Flp pilus assembly protein TadG